MVTAQRAMKRQNQVRHLSRDEGRAFFDRAARRNLGISGDDFLRKWDAGEFDKDSDKPKVRRVSILIPFGRR